ncbi:hypothetical protein IV203_022519 [Nitzschia inconspicua]|uniref:Uncharacterized protein n=1 Tax=Nitzschia inconspicua TaxID=303405 RepID=A0A9K3KJD6_9STRA|nr:hypothetical protein IV203_022519 [Nitzschia inconspicua]
MFVKHIRSIRDMLPVHLAECITSDLDILMKTYASDSFISRKMYRRLCNAYVSKVQKYLSKNPSAEIPLYYDFTNGFYPPSPGSIRKVFESAEESAETPYGYSFKERYTRELHSVDVQPDEAVAFDWTFQLIKNYLLPGDKAAFTGIKGKTNEIISLLIVPSTKTADVSHALIQSRQKRESFSPSVVYTDTCPNAMVFYKAILGTRSK